MKEKCLKLFHVSEIYSAVYFVIVLIITFLAIVISIVFQLDLIVIAIIVIGCICIDIISFIGHKNLKRKAYYAERIDEKVVFYFVDKTIEKNISDFKRIIRTNREIFIFFEDEKIELIKFFGCPEATDWISKKDFPNVK